MWEEADAGGEGEEDDECDCEWVLEQFVEDFERYFGILAKGKRIRIVSVCICFGSTGLV
jgi:hypothetical protein